MNPQIQVETALVILSMWLDRSDIRQETRMHRRAALRWKAIGIVQHDRILNGELAPPITLRTLAQVIGVTK